jgi:hypothetical protein
MSTVRDICHDADAFRHAYPSWPSAEPEERTVTAKQPTPQAISALLCKAGFARSDVIPGRIGWDGRRIRSAKRTDGYRVIKGNAGQVQVSYATGRVVNPDATAKRRAELLPAYARALCAAGWQATVSEPDEWAPRVIVTAPPAGEATGSKAKES